MTSSNMNKVNDFRRAPQSLRGPSLLKRAAILSGFYPEIRKIHRILSPERGSSFNAEVAFFRRFIRPGDLCFDVGANVGGKSEAMLRAGARVVAFEPQPFQVREITARCRRYGGRLTVIESAVGEKSGKAVLHLRRSSVQSSLLSTWEGEPAGEIEVKVTTLDEAISVHGVPRLCKIDVEGFELPVIRGLSHLISVIAIEYHTDEASIDRTRQCLELLRRLGDFQVNATAREDMSFILPTWTSIDAFLLEFPANVQSNHFGDLILWQR